MKSKQLKIVGFISPLLVVISGCGSSGEDSFAEDCNNAKSKMVSLFNDDPKEPADIIVGYKFAAGALYPVMQNSEVKSLTEDIANIELGSNADQNYAQMVNIISKVRSLAVLCGFQSDLNS